MPISKTSARLTRFQCDPKYDVNGNATGAPVDAYLQADFVNDADATDTASKHGEVHFDGLDPALAAVTVTFGGVTTTIPKVFGLMNKMCIQMAAAQAKTP